MNTIIATISLLSTMVWSAPSPAPAQTSIETSSSRTHFNLGVSSNLNTFDLSGQNFGNLAQIANQKIQALNGITNIANQKTAAGTLTQTVAVPPQKFSLLNQVQVGNLWREIAFVLCGRCWMPQTAISCRKDRTFWFSSRLQSMTRKSFVFLYCSSFLGFSCSTATPVSGFRKKTSNPRTRIETEYGWLSLWICSTICGWSF